ncbi:hypothetical protein [Nitrosopumilus piranensis]|uniref:Uncharacterized protein n=1 Tax=Nitrosopumilus piranensis TaxID=1582439 RepID=A0A0C5BRW3_9ARCH|nr:hypothetical protein [Nitrosopumilus piranensis]AJM92483.1 hypothetical protein NPIRD3C_1271 [Nitrosopumilus piranensis]
MVIQHSLMIFQDHVDFYNLVSNFMGVFLDPMEDNIEFKMLDQPCRCGPMHMLLAIINQKKCIAFKRCWDNDRWIRQELIVADAKKKLDFPYYKIMKINGLKIKHVWPNFDVRKIREFYSLDTLMIDFGNYNSCKNFTNLCIGNIKNLDNFCYDYGRWAAFNYLLGVNDRKEENFIFDIDNQVLHSVDNEEGPLEPNRRHQIGTSNILIKTQRNISKFIEGKDKKELVACLQRGFLDGFYQVSKNLSLLHMFTENERQLMYQKASVPPRIISETLFSVS